MPGHIISIPFIPCNIPVLGYEVFYRPTASTIAYRNGGIHNASPAQITDLNDDPENVQYEGYMRTVCLDGSLGKNIPLGCAAVKNVVITHQPLSVENFKAWWENVGIVAIEFRIETSIDNGASWVSVTQGEAISDGIGKSLEYSTDVVNHKVRVTPLCEDLVTPGISAIGNYIVAGN